jgi:hypothetical protein
MNDRTFSSQRDENIFRDPMAKRTKTGFLCILIDSLECMFGPFSDVHCVSLFSTGAYLISRCASGVGGGSSSPSSPLFFKNLTLTLNFVDSYGEIQMGILFGFWRSKGEEFENDVHIK